MREMKNEYKIIVGAAILLAALAIGIYFSTPSQPTTDIGNQTIFPSQSCGVSKELIEADAVWKEATMRGVDTDIVKGDSVFMNNLPALVETKYQIYQQNCLYLQELVSYQRNNSLSLPKSIFRELPVKPANFGLAVGPLLVSWNMDQACRVLGPDYWKQLDFYKNSQGFYNFYSSPPKDPNGLERIGWTGYQAQSAEAISAVKQGDKFSSCIFVSTSAGVQSFQALAFKALVYGGEGNGSIAMQEHYFSDGARSVAMSDMSKYFDIDLTPAHVLLEPSYPWFFSNWTQKVRIDVQVASNTPKGKYMIVVTPSGELPAGLEDQWKLEHPTFVSGAGFYQEIMKLGVEVT